MANAKCSSHRNLNISSKYTDVAYRVLWKTIIILFLIFVNTFFIVL